jgi:hypothetical protein
MTPVVRFLLVAPVLAATAACATSRVREAPIMVNSDRVPSTDSVIAATAQRGEAERARLEATRDSLNQLALATCTGDVCGGLAKGEVMLGMNTAQVMVATRTTPEAWTVRPAGTATVMTPRSLATPPRDAIGEVAMVQVGPSGASTFAYRERQGLRLVSSPMDTTRDARQAVIGDRLEREGDDFLAAGNRELALDRYDRALLLKPRDAMLEYKVASLLDLQLRPVEALMRYQRFLQMLELQRIDAQGRANARLAEAIALAQQRVIVLREQTRAAPPER